MKENIYVSLLCIALLNIKTYAMHTSTCTANNRAALKHTFDGAPNNRKKLSISDQTLDNKLREVLKPVASQSFDEESLSESGESVSDSEDYFKYGFVSGPAPKEPPPWIPVTSDSEANRMITEHMNTDNVPEQPNTGPWPTITIGSQQVFVSTVQNIPSRTPSPEQPRPTTAYPAQRLMRGLTVEWLQTLPDERISLEGLDSELLTPEQKHQLIEHVRATHSAVRHTLDIDDRTLAIDVSKLPECLKPKKQIIHEKALRRSFLTEPLVTGSVCLVLGYMLAKKLSNVSH